MLVLRQQRRLGFTLVEILIALAILAIITAVVFPTAMGQVRKGQMTALANQLDNIKTAIFNFQKNVTRFPTVLGQLTTQPSGVSLDSCGNALTAAQMAAWRGPYLSSAIVGNIPVGDASLQTSLTRVPGTTPPQDGTLRIQVLGVDDDAATSLEAQYDGNANFTTGTIRWVTTGLGQGTLTFLIPIRGC